MKTFQRDELNAAIDRVISELRSLPEFTGLYLSEAPDQGAFIVVQLNPMTEEAKERVRQLLPDFPMKFRNITIAEAL